MKEIHAKCQGEEIAHALRDTRAPATGRELQPEIRAIVRFAAEHDRLDACGEIVLTTVDLAPPTEAEMPGRPLPSLDVYPDMPGCTARNRRCGRSRHCMQR